MKKLQLYPHDRQILWIFLWRPTQIKEKILRLQIQEYKRTFQWISPALNVLHSPHSYHNRGLNIKLFSVLIWTSLHSNWINWSHPLTSMLYNEPRSAGRQLQRLPPLKIFIKRSFRRPSLPAITLQIKGNNNKRYVI